jgi:hypothetical protein
MTTSALIAEVCHEANRVLQRTLGEVVNFPWENTSEALRASGIKGVELAMAGATPEELHESWCATKVAEGWTYGPAKDFAAKTHPQLVPYAELPEVQKVKDRLFQAIVHGLSTVNA